MELRSQEITSLIRKQIESYDEAIVQNDTGTVVSVGDGIARV